MVATNLRARLERLEQRASNADGVAVVSIPAGKSDDEAEALWRSLNPGARLPGLLVAVQCFSAEEATDAG